MTSKKFNQGIKNCQMGRTLSRISHKQHPQEQGISFCLTNTCQTVFHSNNAVKATVTANNNLPGTKPYPFQLVPDLALAKIYSEQIFTQWWYLHTEAICSPFNINLEHGYHFTGVCVWQNLVCSSFFYYLQQAFPETVLNVYFTQLSDIT